MTVTPIMRNGMKNQDEAVHRKKHVQWPKNIPLIKQVFEDEAGVKKADEQKKPVEAYGAPELGGTMWVAVAAFMISILVLDICTYHRIIEVVKRKTNKAIKQKKTKQASH